MLSARQEAFPITTKTINGIEETTITGDRGSGKTHGLLMDYAQHVGKGYGKDWGGLILFHNKLPLDHTFQQASDLFLNELPGTKKVYGRKEFSFPDGECLKFRVAKNVDDYDKFHGHGYVFIGFDDVGYDWPPRELYERLHGIVRVYNNPAVPIKITMAMKS